MAIVGRLLKNVVNIRGRYLTVTLKNVKKSQKNSLRRLLEKASTSSFGRTYEFQKILFSADPVKAFQKSVPYFDYDSIFESWWHKTLEGGKNICWPGKIKYFALSSETSGAPSKQIPVSSDMLSSIRRAGIRHMLTLSQLNLPGDFFSKNILLLGGSTHLNRIETRLEGDLSGILTSHLPPWVLSFYKPGKEIAQEKDWNEKLKQITLAAHKWDVGIIAGVPAWVQMLIEKIIQHYHLKHIHELWPNFLIYAHGGVAFEPYRESFKKLLGKKVFFMETYLASEGFLAYQKKYDHPYMQMVLRNGVFYEFIPFNDHNFDLNRKVKQEAEAFTLDEVREGVDYALVISTNAGAWRYLIGDIVKFTSVENYEMVITGRTKHFLSLCGEHLSVDNMNHAIQMVSLDLGLETREFTVSAIKTTSFFGHHWVIGTEINEDQTKVMHSLDQTLKLLNDDYATERKAALKKIVVDLVPNEVFYQYMEVKGKVGGQFKFPRVMNEEQWKDWRLFLKTKLNRDV